MRIAVLGLGFLGSTIFEVLSKEHQVIGITRDNYNLHKGQSFDIFINANGNSKKYLAEHNPKLDFRLSVLSVYDSLFDFGYNKYIYISSVDIWENNIYGYHKSIAENTISNNIKDYLFIRCCAIIGKGMKKGVIFDILNNKPLHVTLDSRMQFITNTEIANKVSKYLLSKGNKILAPRSIVVKNIYPILNKKIIEPKSSAEYVTYKYSNFMLHGSSKVKTSAEYIKEVI